MSQSIAIAINKPCPHCYAILEFIQIDPFRLDKVVGKAGGHLILCTACASLVIAEIIWDIKEIHDETELTFKSCSLRPMTAIEKERLQADPIYLPIKEIQEQLAKELGGSD